MKLHLNSDQIDELLRHTADNEPAQTADRKHQEDVRTHLRDCLSCQSRMRAHQQGRERLAGLKSSAVSTPSPQCPPDDVWIEVAAGIATQDSTNYLSHAVDCDHCGPLLHQASADFTEGLTPEEETKIAGLHSSTSKWQWMLAARLSSAAVSDPNERLPQPQGKLSRLAAFLSSWRLGFAAAVAAVAIFGTWFALHLEDGRSPEQMIANAYAEKRTLEIRIEGAPYVPLRQERGSDSEQSRMSRPALLKAEAEIAEHLKSNPENVVWLQASGRAGLLEGGVAATDQALAVLDKAQELDPNSHSISVDIASAYLLRGEIADRQEDVGRAIELLGKVLSSEPQNEIAQFNYPIALEKLNLKVQAVEAWEKFLQVHPASQWAEEARRRQKHTQEEIQNRSQRSGQPLRSIELLAAAFKEQRGPEIAGIDTRIEEYQDAALQQWLPAYFDSQGPQGTSLESLRTVLFGLATLSRDRHGDDWLKDLLAADRASPLTQEAVHSLSETERLIQTSDDEHAQAAAIRASLLFHRAGVRAGQLRAALDLILIYQLQHNSRKCEALAIALTKEQRASSYPWVQIESRLEEAACASTSDERALQLAEAAMSIAQQHRYPIAVLRAANFESGSYKAVGDRHRAWATSANFLRQFWAGTFPQMRGYNLLTNLHDLAEEQQQWFLETAVLQEAVPMIASHPNIAMRAFEEDRLGEAELRSGDVQRAESSYHAALALFARVPPGARRDALDAETEVGLAKAAMDSGQPGDAVRRLNRVRPSIAQIADDDLRMEFFQSSGIAEFRFGQQQLARTDLNAAIRLAEQGLRLVSSEVDRWKWRNRNELTYRAMVELELQSDPARALYEWEWFKGASLRFENRLNYMPTLRESALQAQTDNPTTLAGIPADTSLVSFAIFRDRASVWVSDRAQTQQLWISLPAHQLSLLIRILIQHCSDPESNLDTIRKEATELYTMLLQPIDPWIAGHRKLIIEPDGVLRSLPFEILVDSDGEYLGDRYAVTISPGIEYLRRSIELTAITSGSDISIIGNPIAPGWAPLPEAEQEARAVAALFSHPRLALGQIDLDGGVIHEIGRTQLFHFSGHASTNVQSAGLVIGGSGLLDAFHVEDSNRGRTQLVVLSACNSSRGSTGFFDDEDSFVRRLMEARVPTVVASRWLVDSSATSELMKRFYAPLLAGKSVSESLTAARRDIRSQPQFAHPFYWAGFSVFGRS